MPIYEYQCQSCGHELEKIQRMSDDPLSDCPSCERPELKRLVSAAGFRLKGGGWYETDFKQGNQRNLAGGDSDGGKAKAGSKGEGGGEGGKSGKTSSGDSTSKSDTKKPSGTTGKAASA